MIEVEARGFKGLACGRWTEVLVYARTMPQRWIVDLEIRHQYAYEEGMLMLGARFTLSLVCARPFATRSRRIIFGDGPAFLCARLACISMDSRKGG